MLIGYTNDQIFFIKNCKLQNMTWKQITDKFNSKFQQNKSIFAIQKTYDRYKNIDSYDDSYINAAKDIFKTKKQNSFISKENKILLQHLSNIDVVKESLEEVSKNIKFKIYPVPKFKKNKIIDRTILAHLSDTHYGCIVKKTHNGNINEYNETIASRRTACFFWQIYEYAKYNIETTKLVLIINGDVFAGLIHETNGVELLYKQFSMVINILGQGITYLANKFPEVVVRVTSGNHDRIISKNDEGRVYVNKFNSYATMAYLSLQRELKKYKNIDFIIDEKPFLDFTIYNWRVYATHTDTVFNIGNPGKTIKMNEISAQINRINNSDLVKNKKFDMFFFAHVHIPVATVAEGGEHVFINGSLVGLDSFSQGIGINVNRPMQQFVEVTEKYIGNLRFCSLQEADENNEWDKIIK